MKDGLVEHIQSLGHWRVNIRPLSAPSKLLTLAECREVVTKSSVSLRGWDYPHISTRDDSQGGVENVGDFVQGWCDWYHHVEFWRMYKSTQYLHYKALREDLTEDAPGKPSEPSLGVGTSVYTMTELVEFAFRLFRAGLYGDGALINVTIGNTAGRQLWIDDPRRMGFSYPRTTAATKIEIQREVSAADFRADPIHISSEMAVELFDHFGWTVDRGRVQADQAQFYKRQF
ncbi:Hypothetical protein NGAL_HAMBI1145_04100 [Neorhizobium galegae bv. officinalis]|uniref:Uncharacterized protein n=1 Tax=Neorhizobium galegae bv. officinalis TaxID=323656 RepID=A0A0T7F9B6_NEOGA|nr:hypothetical protein [Neorhizobium galegae]CDZ31647.1 Hypothetical protein NGAL_HAMBI1145_04100 [Neorhizobium galegae bv. officinalis]